MIVCSSIYNIVYRGLFYAFDSSFHAEDSHNTSNDDNTKNKIALKPISAKHYSRELATPNVRG